MKAIILIGMGGHARVLLDTMRCLNISVLGYVAPSIADSANIKINYLGNDEEFFKSYSPKQVTLVNGIGSVSDTERRTEVFKRCKEKRFSFLSVVHPSAVVAQNVQLGEGCQLMAGSVIQSGVKLGENTIINTRAGVDHDCIIGSHVHVSIGSTIAGSVCVGEGAHVGAGATVIQGVQVGSKSVIGAGAVVLSDVISGNVVVGIPASILKS